jgi:hypothetical protein
MNKKPKFFARKPVQIGCIILAGLALTGAGTGTFLALRHEALFEADISDSAASDMVKTFSPLTGVETVNKLARRPVTAVMIENSPDARPQSGLAYDNVVFEAVAEGGITRFIVLYQEAQPEILGPVRSVRPYYLEWARAFDPAVAHVGGSDEALRMIRSGSYGLDMDQFFNEKTYWRATDRYAPHNVYTSMDNLFALETSGGKTASSFTPWSRQDEQPAEIAAYSTINMPVSTGVFAVSYDYNSDTNTYLRKLGGVPHTDRERGPIAPKVVIALMVDTGLDADGSHSAITTTGTGDCYIFQNGTVTTAHWSRASFVDQLHFTNQAGEEIALNRGQTWITAVSSDRNVTWQ